MNKNKITQNQYMYIIFSAMLGVGLLALASGVSREAHQNGWISILVVSVYPFFTILLSSIINKRTNQSDYWEISKKLYGRILTIIFSFIFFIFFLTVYVAIISGFTNVLRITIVDYLEPLYIIVPALVLSVSISVRGLSMVGRISEFYFYITLPLLFIPLFFINKGSLTNILPLKFSIEEMIKAIPESLYAFTGCEVSFFIINKITNRNKPGRAGMIASSLITIIYTFSVFMIIYYMGWEVSSKLEYPLLFLIQSIDFPIISNFLAIVIFLWSSIILRTLVVYSYTGSHIISNIIKKDQKVASFIFLVIALGSSLFMIPEHNRKEIISLVMPYLVSFTIGWGVLTTILVMIKYRGEKNKNQ